MAGPRNLVEIGRLWCFPKSGRLWCFPKVVVCGDYGYPKFSDPLQNRRLLPLRKIP